MVDDYSFFGSTVDFVIKNEHLGVLPDLAFSKRQRRIFHKRKSLYMLSKGKCICMLKRKFCVASF
jgi:hypothetical protein